MKKFLLRFSLAVAIISFHNDCFSNSYTGSSSDCSGAFTINNGSISCASSPYTLNDGDDLTFTISAQSTKVRLSLSSGAINDDYEIYINGGITTDFSNPVDVNDETDVVVKFVKKSSLANSNAVISWDASAELSGLTISTTPTCSGAANGEATVVGGSGSVSYTWKNSAGVTLSVSGNEATGLAAGSYSVSAVKGCLSKSFDFNIEEPSQMTIASDITNCTGGNNGKIEVIPSGGKSPYTYSWNTGASTNMISGLPAGYYSAIVTDACGSQQWGIYAVIVENELKIESSYSSNYNGYGVSCYGKKDGYAGISVSGGKSPYTYKWVKEGDSGFNATTQSINNIGAGKYTVAVTDSDGKTVDQTFTLTDTRTDELKFGSETITEAINGNDGKIEISEVTNAAGTSYNVSWSNNINNNSLTASNLGAGTYSATVTDENGCTATATYSMTTKLQITKADSSNYNGYGVSCYGKEDGYAKVEVTGGKQPYTFKWTKNGSLINSAVTSSIMNIAAGEYEVTVTDAAGKQVSRKFTLPESRTGVLTIGSATITNVTGKNINNDGSIEISEIKNYVGSYKINWSENVTAENGKKLSLSKLEEGVYALKISDENNCTLDTVFVVSKSVNDGGVITADNNGYLCVEETDESVKIDIAGGGVNFKSKFGIKPIQNPTPKFVWLIKKETETEWTELNVSSSNLENYSLNDIDTTQNLLFKRETQFTYEYFGKNGSKLQQTDVYESNVLTFKFVKPEVAVILGLADSYCQDSALHVPVYGIPVKGKFTINGIKDNDNEGKTSFLPKDPGVANINYDYTDSHGCSKTVSKSVIINEVPTPTFTLPDTVLFGQKVTLNNYLIPAIGDGKNVVTFSGDGVTTSNGNYVWATGNLNNEEKQYYISGVLTTDKGCSCNFSDSSRLLNSVVSFYHAGSLYDREGDIVFENACLIDDYIYVRASVPGNASIERSSFSLFKDQDTKNLLVSGAGSGQYHDMWSFNPYDPNILGKLKDEDWTYEDGVKSVKLYLKLSYDTYSEDVDGTVSSQSSTEFTLYDVDDMAKFVADYDENNSNYIVATSNGNNAKGSHTFSFFDETNSKSSLVSRFDIRPYATCSSEVEAELIHTFKHNASGCISKSDTIITLCKKPDLQTNIQSVYNKEAKTSQIIVNSKNDIPLDRLDVSCYSGNTLIVGAIDNIDGNFRFSPNKCLGNVTFMCVYTYNSNAIDTLLVECVVEEASGVWRVNEEQYDSESIVLCKNEEETKISIEVNNAHHDNKSGKFFFNGNEIGTNTTEITLNPADFLKSSVDTLKYVYTYGDTAEFWLTKIINIDQWGDLNFPVPESGICSNADTIHIPVSVGDTVPTNFFMFRGYDENEAEKLQTVGAYAVFDPQGLSDGLQYLKFIYVSPHGCTDTVSRSIRIKTPRNLIFKMKDIYNVDSVIPDFVTYVSIADNMDWVNVSDEYISNGLFNLESSNSFADAHNGRMDNDVIQTLAGKLVAVSYSYTDTNNCVTTVCDTALFEKAKGDFIMADEYCRYDNISNAKASVSKSLTDEELLQGIGYYLNNQEPVNSESFNGAFEDRLLENLTKTADGKYCAKLSYDYFLKYKEDSALFSLSKDFKIIDPQKINVTFNDQCKGDYSVSLNDMVNSGEASNMLFYNMQGENLTEINFSDYDWGESISVICRIKYSDDEKCLSQDTAEIKIQNLPELVDFNLDTMYCANSDDVQIELSYPEDGGESVFVIGNDTVDVNLQMFSPKNYEGEVTVAYSYTSGINNSCLYTAKRTIRINSIPKIEMDELSADFCNGDTIVFKVKPVENSTNSDCEGIFFVNNDSVRIDKSNTFSFGPENGGAFDAVYHTDSTYIITFVLKENGCSSNLYDTVTVHPLPELSISNLVASYCANGSSEIQLTANGNALDNCQFFASEIKDGVENDYKEYVTDNEGKFMFNAVDFADNYDKTIRLDFNYVDNKGCKNSNNEDVLVYAKPDVSFNPSNICLVGNNEIEFTPEIKYCNNMSYMVWDFGDGKTMTVSADSSDLSITHRYSEADKRKVSLTVKDSNECELTHTEQYSFVNKPQANFIWDNECASVNAEHGGRNETVIHFTNKSNLLNDVDITWSFDDDNTSRMQYDDLDYAEMVKSQNPSFTYVGIQNRNVKLKVSVNDQCQDSIVRTIYVRPTEILKVNNLYVADFEGQDKNYWERESTVSPDEKSTWTWADFDGNDKCWMVNGKEILKDTTIHIYNESSAITSPCFDFSKLDKPMISMNVFNQTEKDHDGAVLQYTVDNGKSWTNVGSVGGGVNWYNSQGVSAAPGGSIQGWSGADSTNWFNVRYDLDAVKNKKNVRFRIAYASDAGGADFDGFAFDNVVISNRTRRVLIEHFTNTQSPTAVNANAIVDGVRFATPKDAISIQYHTSYPVGDMFNLSNPLVNSVRENYYGVNSVPYTIVDGADVYNYYGASVLDTTEIMSRVLYDPLFDVKPTATVSGSQYNVTVNLTAQENISDRQLLLYAAVVESNAKNGSVVYHNVLRQLLPLPSGEYIKSTWSKGDKHSYNYSYQPESGIDMNDLNVVAFVQDEITGEILQTGTTDTITVARPYVGTFVETVETEPLEMSVYPNPASDKINIAFNDAVDGYVELINQQGAIVRRVDFDTYSYGVSIDVSDLHQGLYIVKSVTSHGVSVSRVIVE